MEKIGEEYPPTGAHVDAADDGDHDCDECGASDVSKHTFKGYTVTSTKLGGYESIYRCTECRETRPVTATASIFGNGSVTVVLSLSGIAVLAAVIAFWTKRKATEKTERDNEI